MTRNENATNEQYAYEIEGNIEITTYRNNLIEEIKEKLKDKKATLTTQFRISLQKVCQVKRSKNSPTLLKKRMSPFTK